jgi:hypothetical protein
MFARRNVGGYSSVRRDPITRRYQAQPHPGQELVTSSKGAHASKRSAITTRSSLRSCGGHVRSSRNAARISRNTLLAATNRPVRSLPAFGVTQSTIWNWLAGKRQSQAQLLAKLWRFLDNEAKRQPQGSEIRPIERLPFKIVKPTKQVRYAQLCPFCRKARGKIQSISRKRFQRACPKCGAKRTRARERAASAQSVERPPPPSISIGRMPEPRKTLA